MVTDIWGNIFNTPNSCGWYNSKTGATNIGPRETMYPIKGWDKRAIDVGKTYVLHTNRSRKEYFGECIAKDNNSVTLRLKQTGKTTNIPLEGILETYLATP